MLDFLCVFVILCGFVYKTSLSSSSSSHLNKIASVKGKVGKENIVAKHLSPLSL